MAVAVVIFTLMSLQYKYVEGDELEEDIEKLKRISLSSSSSSSSNDDETGKKKEIENGEKSN